MLLLLIGRGVCASTRWQWKTLSRSLTHWCMTARRLRRRGRVVMRMHRVGHSQFAAIGVWLPGVHRLESLACHVPCARYQSLLWGHLHLSVCPMSRVGFVTEEQKVVETSTWVKRFSWNVWLMIRLIRWYKRWYVKITDTNWLVELSGSFTRSGEWSPWLYVNCVTWSCNGSAAET